MSVRDISLLDLSYIYVLLLVPLALMLVYRIVLIRKTLIAVVRMSAQLYLVGIYLKYIFQLNNVYLNVAWLLVMITVANTNVLSSAKLRVRALFPITFIGIAFSTLAVLSVFVFASVRPTPPYDARYLIPLAGMLLGNCMRGNIIALERFYSGLVTQQKEYQTYIFMGATVREACGSHFRKALSAALSPTASTMATMGIVSLPGMMTGQILGGSDPMTAIKYQMAIMVAIFVTVAVGAWLNLRLSMRVAFNGRGMLRREVLKQ
jgi:putative ABC transport system permease protein